MKTAYFHIKDAKNAGEKMVLSGDYIVADTIEVKKSDDTSTPAKPKPNITIPGPMTVKWILPPRTSGIYGDVKNAANAMGYETVEFDDFSYPPPRR